MHMLLGKALYCDQHQLETVPLRYWDPDSCSTENQTRDQHAQMLNAQGTPADLTQTDLTQTELMHAEVNAAGNLVWLLQY